MRILIISNYYPPVELGGWEQLTCNVAGQLRERGHQVYVLTSNYRKGELVEDGDSPSRVLHLESPDPVRYHPHYSLLRAVWERQNEAAVTTAVRDFKPDILFVNGMWNLPYSVARRAEALLPGRVVYYLASYWPTEQDAHTAYWQDVNRSGWRGVPKRILSALVQRTLVPGEPRNRLDFTRVLCVSGFLREYAVSQAGIPRERTRVVHNGIELDLFQAREGRQSPGTLRLLYAGRLSPDKGVHTVIESLALLAKNYPDLQPRLSIYGGGPADYEGRLKESVRKAGLNSRVSFCGLIPREEMPSAFAEHDVLVFPSIWSEPLARIVQEAMASGLVVVGTCTGGTGEILKDGENGLVFESENPGMLAEKIRILAGNPALQALLAAAARSTVEQHFSLERMVDEIEANFQEILSEVERAFG